MQNATVLNSASSITVTAGVLQTENVIKFLNCGVMLQSFFITAQISNNSGLGKTSCHCDHIQWSKYKLWFVAVNTTG